MGDCLWSRLYDSYGLWQDLGGGATLCDPQKSFFINNLAHGQGCYSLAIRKDAFSNETANIIGDNIRIRGPPVPPTPWYWASSSYVSCTRTPP